MEVGVLILVKLAMAQICLILLEIILQWVSNKVKTMDQILLLVAGNQDEEVKP